MLGLEQAFCRLDRLLQVQEAPEQLLMLLTFLQRHDGRRLLQQWSGLGESLCRTVLPVAHDVSGVLFDTEEQDLKA